MITDYRCEIKNWITDMRLKNFVSITVIYHYNFRYLPPHLCIGAGV